MKQNNYDTIICDLGNVLISFDHNIAVRKLLDYTPNIQKDIYNLFFDSTLTKLFEEGKIAPDKFFQDLKEMLHLDMDYNTFLPIWNDIFFETPLNIKMQKLLKSVKSVYRLVMLSNINKLHFEFLKKRMGIFREFDRLVLSYEEGCRKPAAEIYSIALQSAATTPPSVFYIDDRRDLVEAASSMGIKGIVFDGERSFEAIGKVLWQDI